MPMNARLLRPTTGFSPASIPGLALWLDAAASDALFTTDAGPVNAVSSPLDISGCALWLDASDASTITTATGVSVWADKSGNARNATQATGGKQPAYNATINGKNVVTFQGTDDTMQIAPNAAFNSNSQTIMIVAKQASSANQALYYKADSNSANGVIMRYRESSEFWLFQKNDNTAQTLRNTSNPSTAAALYVAILEPTAQAGFVNGSFASPNGTGTVTTAYDNDSGPFLGSRRDIGEYLTGDIAEVIVYPTALSTADRVRVEAYLAAKWGIANVHAPAVTASQPVGFWRDRSGSKHFTQPTAASRPVVGSQNGRKTVAMDGVNDFLTAVNPLPTSMPVTMLLAQRIVAGSAFGMTYTNSNLFNIRQTGSPGVPSILPGNFGGTGLAARVGSNDILSLRYPSTGNNELYINGAPIAVTDTTGRPDLSGTHAIGVRRAADGTLAFHANVQVAEILAYNRALTAAERRKAEIYLARKWGITLAPQVANADAQDWVNRVYANGGTVSTSTAAAVDTFCSAIESAGIRDRFFRLNLLCGTGLNAALVPLYRGPSRTGSQVGNTTDTNNGPFVSTDYSESVGLTSDSSGKFLRTGMNMGDLDTVGTGHMSVCYGALTTSQQNLLGACSASPLDRYTIQFNNATQTTSSWGSNEAANNTGGNVIAADGMFTSTRRSATDLAAYENATERGTQLNSVTPSAGNIEFHVFRTNLAIGSFPAYVNRIRGYSVGRSVTAEQVTDFYNAMKTLQDALGRTQT